MSNEMNCEGCEGLLFDFQEGRLESSVATRVDAHLKNCSECSSLLNDIWQMNLVSSRWQDEPVRAWDRSNHLFPSRQWQFPQIFAVAASVLALVIVITDTRVITNEDGIALKMGGSGYVSGSTLEELQVKQDSSFNQRFLRLTAQQVASNQLVLRSVLEASRQERREDFGTLVSYWNATQALQHQQAEENLKYILARQVEDGRDIRQLNTALQEANFRRGNDM
jgi:hypothetical protein